MSEQLKKDALEYHSQSPAGKVKTVPTKSCTNARELSLAYTPGVAFPCLEIQAHPELGYEYTSRGNLVAVISNGTAVLGLGDIGPLAGKPVMEGKGVLFKRFAGVDVFDLEINEKDPQKVIEIVTSLEPTFGGINLEDIKAPECFQIEEELIKRLKIPVFHDDQHGTAVISSAALLNALEITDKKIGDIKVVFSGAGAAAIACANLYLDIGVKLENVLMVDSKGVITTKRLPELNAYKTKYAQDTSKTTLTEALQGADVFVGVSQANLLTPEMVQSMASKPIIFALANPTPEISYDLAKQAVPEAIVATGRSDFPNQVNNVLGFPFIFRGALDVRANTINKEMKLAAVKALAKLAHLNIPNEVVQAYGKEFSFGADYIIPKPFDPRVLFYVAPAVAQAAMDSGVARKPITDMKEYVKGLKKLAKKLAKGKF
jgi:malate dehydrogenase (oxaloacetate-decarboxylating)(NADP+)